MCNIVNHPVYLLFQGEGVKFIYTISTSIWQIAHSNCSLPVQTGHSPFKLGSLEFSEGGCALNSASIFKSKPVLESRAALDSKTGLLLKIEAELTAQPPSENSRLPSLNGL